MSADARQVFRSNTDDASFRAWAQAIHASILAGGMVAVTATGEADLTTILRPTTTVQKRGFKMYKLAGHDGLPDIFMRVDYGSSQGSFPTPGNWFQIGYGHNGAGGFTGNNTGSLQLSQNTGALLSTDTFDVFCSGDGLDRFTMVPSYQPGATGDSYALVIHAERLKDTAGVPTSAGFYIYSYALNGLGGGGSNGLIQVIPAAGTPPAAVETASAHPALNPVNQHGGGAATFGSNVAVTAHMPCLGRQFITSLLVYRAADFVGTPVNFSVDHLGAGRAYKGLGAAGPSAGKCCASNTGGASLAIPFY